MPTGDEPLRLLVIEATGHIGPPKRYLSRTRPVPRALARTASATCAARPSRCWSTATDVEVLRPAPARAGPGYAYAHHPFDVVGWDGCLYPWAFSIHDFEPITGRVHQPPPVHQTFEGPNFVICSFVPRKVDYHPLAIPVPYNHHNVDSDEMLFYTGGNYEARARLRHRAGLDLAAPVRLHPRPAAGRGRARRSAPSYFDELAVMVDTFRPLDLCEPALACEDTAYAWTWAGRSSTRRRPGHRLSAPDRHLRVTNRFQPGLSPTVLRVL